MRPGDTAAGTGLCGGLAVALQGALPEVVRRVLVIGAVPGGHEPGTVPLDPADGAAVGGFVGGEDQARAGERRHEPAARPQRLQPGHGHRPHGHRGDDPVVLARQRPGDVADLHARGLVDQCEPIPFARHQVLVDADARDVLAAEPGTGQGGAVAGARGDEHLVAVGDHRGRYIRTTRLGSVDEEVGVPSLTMPTPSAAAMSA